MSHFGCTLAGSSLVGRFNRLNAPVRVHARVPWEMPVSGAPVHGPDGAGRLVTPLPGARASVPRDR